MRCFASLCGKSAITNVSKVYSPFLQSLMDLVVSQANPPLSTVFDLSPKALSHLRTTISQSPKPVPSTATEFPPLYRPGFSFLVRAVGSTIATVTRSRNRAGSQDYFGQGLTHKHSVREARGGIISTFNSACFLITNPFRIFITGFATRASWKGRDQRKRAALSAARRYRPVIVLIHLSTEGRNVLKTLFTGFVEVILLLVLTFFFAAQWGGNLVITFLAMGLMVVFVTAGRAVGLIYVYVSAKVWGLHVVHCDEREEVRGVLRVMCSMTGVLVKVNGAAYCDGFRLNDVDGFLAWRKTYDRGGFDEDDDDTTDEVKEAQGLLLARWQSTSGTRDGETYHIPKSPPVRAVDSVSPPTPMLNEQKQGEVRVV